MRLDEAIRAVKRDSVGGSSISRHAHGTGRTITFGFIDEATWTLTDILAEWEILPPQEPEKPREWVLEFAHEVRPRNSVGVLTGISGDQLAGRSTVRVHDADACDKEKRVCCEARKDGFVCSLPFGHFHPHVSPHIALGARGTVCEMWP